MKWQLLGERRAVALLMMGFYTTIFFLMGVLLGGDWLTFFMALALVYGVGFFALAAEWFWARWYALGIGMSGISMALIGLANLGWNEALAIWGGMHLLVYLPLLGEKMAGRYEGQTAWRERYGLDEYGVTRVKRAVSGAATALPTMVMFTLAPKQDQNMVAMGLLGLVILGFVGLLRMKFWGVSLLGAVILGLGTLVLFGAGSTTPFLGEISTAMVRDWTALTTSLALAIAVSPFLRPAYRYLKNNS